MKVFSATDIQVAAKDTIFQSVEHPLDMQVGVQADRLNLMVRSDTGSDSEALTDKHSRISNDVVEIQ